MYVALHVSSILYVLFIPYEYKNCSLFQIAGDLVSGKKGFMHQLS